MDPNSYKTLSAKPSTIQQEWLLVDAAAQPLGRLASQIAALLRGKHKPCVTPNTDCGDKVIVINAEKVHLSGNKWHKKQYTSHTGYPGGQRTATPRQLLEKFPTRIIEHAVRGMLPKNRLRKEHFRNLFVYAGPEHQHAAQQPKQITLKN